MLLPGEVTCGIPAHETAGGFAGHVCVCPCRVCICVRVGY